MARKQRTTETISISAAAAAAGVHRWQVARVARDYRIIPIPAQPGQDRRCKWFPKRTLLTMIRQEYPQSLAA